jgi:ribonuclease Z
MKSRTIIFAAGLVAGIAIVVILSFKNNHSNDKIKEVSLNARERGVYFPNSESLAPDEMRIISLGTGMPYGRRAQAATSWLVELGNGDKFLFDVGTGSVANLGSMEIPYDFLNKVFLSHLHTDHMGDLPALYVGGVVGGRTLPFHVWGPSGSEERLGLNYAMKHLQEFVAWDLEGRKGRLPTQAFNLIAHEFNFKEENHIVYEENGVVVRAWPAIHAIDGSVSYALEWSGLKFVFGGDTYPNKWMDIYAKNADIVIHECMMSAETAIEDMGFPPARALEVMTQIHTAPEAFGKVMSSLKPRMAIAFHFFMDFNVAPGINDGIRKTYDGPLSLADDLMVWNVTKDKIRVRNVAPVEEAWPAPTPYPIPPVDTKGMKNVSPEIQAGTFDVVAENMMIYDRVNKKYGTNFEPRVK